MRWTRRGKLLGWTLLVAALAAYVLGSLALGQAQRCDWLRDHADPATYAQQCR